MAYKVPPEDPWETRIRPVFDELVKTMRPLRFLDKLYAENLVSTEKYKEIQQIPTSEAQSRFLLMNVLAYVLRQQENFDKFCEILQNTPGQAALLDVIPPAGRYRARNMARETPSSAGGCGDGRSRNRDPVTITPNRVIEVAGVKATDHGRVTTHRQIKTSSYGGSPSIIKIGSIEASGNSEVIVKDEILQEDHTVLCNSYRTVRTRDHGATSNRGRGQASRSSTTTGCSRQS